MRIVVNINWSGLNPPELGTSALCVLADKIKTTHLNIILSCFWCLCQSPIKSGSNKDKSKDKKKKSVPELVQDAPIRRSLGSVHIPLGSLVKGDHKVDVLCDLGALHAESEVVQTLGKGSLHTGVYTARACLR